MVYNDINKILPLLNDYTNSTLTLIKKSYTVERWLSARQLSALQNFCTNLF